MEKIIDGVLTIAYLGLLTFGGGYTLEKGCQWIKHAALEKASTGLGSLEAPTRQMTGGKLDF
ncbi:MAG: hypothetical protein PHY93_20735 [Bacteriovorax sp.]|nr:hypothetical protein [Bacteriovorax sp.]